MSGRIEGKTLPARFRVHLVPAEAEAETNLLRYAEIVTSDGRFTLNHLAPGQYWLSVRPVPETESSEQPATPVAWEAAARTRLRREAQAAQQTLTLAPCQRVKDVVLK